MQFSPPYTLVGENANLALHFHPDHLADLWASGLNDDTIRRAGIYSLAPTLMHQFFSGYKGVPQTIKTALCFPYQDGEFARIKLFPALGKMKYAQPPKTSARLYRPFPITAGLLYICEGEKKTLAAHQAGMNAAGIGGVWNWLSSGNPINDLNLIQWDGRDIVIIPDSDAFQRQELLRPVYALGRELRDRGAAVSVAEIPQPGQKKIGLDDYLVAGGHVEDLETFTLGGRTFRSASFWYGRWKLKAVLAA
jgi:Domain of unknown function (DUF3854)